MCSKRNSTMASKFFFGEIGLSDVWLVAGKVHKTFCSSKQNICNKQFYKANWPQSWSVPHTLTMEWPKANCIWFSVLHTSGCSAKPLISAVACEFYDYFRHQTKIQKRKRLTFIGVYELTNCKLYFDLFPNADLWNKNANGKSLKLQWWFKIQNVVLTSLVNIKHQRLV